MHRKLLFDPNPGRWPPARNWPCVAAQRPVGIAIANADAAAGPLTGAAILEANPAVQELLTPLRNPSAP